MSPAKWAVQRSIKSGPGNGSWNADERVVHFSSKLILFYWIQQVFRALTMWMKLKSQLKLKQWFDITERTCCMLSLASVSSFSCDSWPHAAPSFILAQALLLICSIPQRAIHRFVVGRFLHGLTDWNALAEGPSEQNRVFCW